MVPRIALPEGGRLFQRKSLTSPLRVQCSVPPFHVVVEPSAATAMHSSMRDIVLSSDGQCKASAARCRALLVSSRECRQPAPARRVTKPIPHGVVNGAGSVTEVVLRAMSRAPDARLREVMESLV